jgi:hypothetical protein
MWMHSCKYNSEVQFFLFGSHLPEESPVENVRFFSLTTEELRQKVSESTGVQAQIGSPRKICDFRPAFGQIFREHLEPFDFWGYCDLDVVWGNLSPLVEDEILKNSDIISVRGDLFLSGACTLYRNTKALRTLYRSSSTWKDVFTDPNHWVFDENLGRGQVRPPDERRRRGEPVSMLDIAVHEIKEDRLSFHTPNSPYVIQELKPKFEFSLEWDEGTLTSRKQGEVLAYHLIFAKKNPFFRIPKWGQMPSSFIIDSQGIRNSSTNKVVYETIRLISGVFNWVDRMIRQKIHNARVKFNERL